MILETKVPDSTNKSESDKVQTIQENKSTSIKDNGNEDDKVSTNKETANIILVPFKKHLTFPEESLKKKHGSCFNEKLPSAISSVEWRTGYEHKNMEKKKKLGKSNLKRKSKEEKKVKVKLK